MKEIIKGAGLIFIIKVFGAVALFLINILISNYYGAKYLGIFNLLFALFQISAILSRVGLDVFTVKTLPTLPNNELISAYLKKVARLLLTFSGIVVLVIAFFAEQIDTYLFRTVDASNFIFISTFLIIPYTFFTVLPEVLRGFDEIKNYSILKNALLNICIIFSLLFLYQYAELKNEPVIALFIGISLATFIAFLMVIIFLKKQGVPRKSSKYKVNILRESYPMFLTSSVLFLMNNVDSFMIGYFEDEAQVGYYNACVRLSFAITFILTAINGFVAPKFAKLYHHKNLKELKSLYYKSLKLIWITVAPILLLLFLFPDLFLGLFGKEFLIASSTLIILNSSYMINAFFGSTGQLLNMTGNQKVFMLIIIIAFIINVTGNIFLIPLYGISGAATATLISMSLWNVIAFLKLKNLKLI